MARTDSLGNYLTDVATAIKEKKGDSTPILASDFDTEIANLPSGGGKTETLAQLNEKANELVAYYRSIPSTYTSSTDENVTLYTPDETCKTYAIVKRVNGMYRIVWLKNNIGLSLIRSSTIYYLRPWYINVIQLSNFDLSLYSNEIVLGLYGFSGYRSGDMSSINQCLSAIQSNTTSYSSFSNGYETVSKDTNYDVPFCNTFIIDTSLDTQATTQKISSNETIEVISS